MHNFLQCQAKGCKALATGASLKVQIEQLETRPADYNPEFIRSLLPKLNYPALVEVAADLDLACRSSLPGEIADEGALSDESLRAIHAVLLESNVVAGRLVCGGCARTYEITDSVPDMLVASEEA